MIEGSEIKGVGLVDIDPGSSYERKRTFRCTKHQVYHAPLELIPKHGKPVTNEFLRELWELVEKIEIRCENEDDIFQLADYAYYKFVVLPLLAGHHEQNSNVDHEDMPELDVQVNRGKTSAAAASRARGKPCRGRVNVGVRCVWF